MTALCSAASRAREEPLAATASRVERWLLVEHRGAWGPQSVPSTRLPVATARALAQAAERGRARLLMVRRPGRGTDAHGRHVFAVDSRPGHEQIRARHLGDDADLVGVEWADGPEWEPYDDPLYLVCTHGRHDRCCALLGRPVAKALSAAYPEATWETSHVGGDRFAPNLVVLPEGLYLGRVDTEDVVRVVSDLMAGQLPPGRVRGRSSLPLPVQAAQSMAREALSRWGSEELDLVKQTAVERDTWRVRLRDPDVEVVVRYDPTGGGVHSLTCNAEQAKAAPVFRQVSISLG